VRVKQGDAGPLGHRCGDVRGASTSLCCGAGVLSVSSPRTMRKVLPKAIKISR
jgi:hypothetical protein